jgi:hypothetical protein
MLHLTKRAIAVLAAALMATAAHAEEPLVLKGFGSFHIGGKLVELKDKPVRDVVFTPGGPPAKVDPNGIYVTGQMYVQYFIPQKERGRFPLLLWHGGGLTGVTYETTPDGRTGWLDFFLRKGWASYNSDGVERGRAGWSSYPDIFKTEPLFLTTGNAYERFRIGQGAGSFDQDIAKRKQLAGNQFPADGYDNFVKQIVPRWTSTDDAAIEAYIAEVDKVCPCVLLFHSQAGQFGFKVAQARPDKVKALIAVEPSSVGNPATIATLKDIPVLMVFGDHIAQDPRWPIIRKTAVTFAEQLRAAGGSVDVIDLPEIGIKGNSHMLMMDRNNLEVADVIQKWLVGKNLYQ